MGGVSCWVGGVRRLGDRGGLGLCLCGAGKRIVGCCPVGQAQGTSRFESECLLAKKMTQTFSHRPHHALLHYTNLLYASVPGFETTASCIHLCFREMNVLPSLWPCSSRQKIEKRERERNIKKTNLPPCRFWFQKEYRLIQAHGIRIPVGSVGFAFCSPKKAVQLE